MSNLDVKINDESIKETIKTVDKHFGTTYDNLTQPVTKAVGNGIGDIVELVFSPFRFFKEGVNLFFGHFIKVFKKELEEKENSIPADKKIEPDFHAVSMALDNSKFCITNDELRKMLVNLIGNTMNTDKKDIAHPAFSEIIKQMTTLDALILESFIEEAEQPIVKIIEDGKNECFRIILNNYYIPKIKNLIFSTESCSISISNLQRLGVLSVTYDDVLDCDELYVHYKESIERKYKGYKIENGIVYLTEVGEAFMKACME